MRFMVIVKATKDTENEGAPPDPQLMADMNKFNDELLEAGVLLGYDGLHPSSKGAIVRFSGNNRTVVDGPFAETKELIAGYWLIQVKSMQEAIEFLLREAKPGDAVMTIGAGNVSRASNELMVLLGTEYRVEDGVRRED